MPLFSKSLSPSRSTLSIPQVSGGTASAVHSLASSRSPSPLAPANQSENPKRMQDDTFRNVKLVEELLRAWNDHRQALSACAKTGKRLAKAMDELSQGLDKTSITSQTLRPTASALEQSAEVTAKWAKRVDKGYEACNKEAGSYFSLLAKETRSHEAYLLGINKRHSSAEKAYRRASKNLSETSSTHTALLHLQQSLSADVQRANADHLAILSSKQGSLLLSVAAHAGIIGTGLTNYHSESLKVAATNYKDIEYCKSFQDHVRVLAEARWVARAPGDLDEDDSRIREMMRIQKARVAMGELDIVGNEVWDRISHKPRMERVVSESVLTNPASKTYRPNLPMSQSSAFSGSSMMTASTTTSTSASTATGMTYMSSPTTSPSTGKGSWGGRLQSDTKTNPPPRPLPSSPNDRFDHPRSVPRHQARSSSVSIPTPRRSVSQIAADLEALTYSGSKPKPTHTDSPTPNREIRGIRDNQTTLTPQADKGNRRVTMPPIYTGAQTLPAVQPRRASIQPKPIDGGGSGGGGGFPFPIVNVASPTPKRALRMATAELELAADRE